MTDPARRAAIVELSRRDPRFATITARFGPPPAWDREPGFPTPLHARGRRRSTG